MSEISETLAERGKRYGRFGGHAQITQDMKATFRMITIEGKNKWNQLAYDQQEALDMIAHKLGRILNGDPDYADSWIDIAGYAKLVADRLEKKDDSEDDRFATLEALHSKPPETVIVPDVSGLNVNEAIDRLAEVGIEASAVGPTNDFYYASRGRQIVHIWFKFVIGDIVTSSKLDGVFVVRYFSASKREGQGVKKRYACALDGQEYYFAEEDLTLHTRAHER